MFSQYPPWLNPGKTRFSSYTSDGVRPMLVFGAALEQPDQAPPAFRRRLTAESCGNRDVGTAKADAGRERCASVFSRAAEGFTADYARA